MFRQALRTIPKQASFAQRGYAKNSKKTITINFDYPYKLHLLEKGPATSSTTTREELLDFFTEMTRIRVVEIQSDTAYKSKQIRGFLHLYSGQEAVCSGLDSEMTTEDCVITAYRCHGYMLTRRGGSNPRAVLAELLGKKTGCSQGKGGSMHMYSIDRNFYGGNGIVGSQIPAGLGLAFAQKFVNNGAVTVAAMGDGAANQGQVYESINLAALHQLPCIFLVENNRYGMGTSVSRASATPEFYTRGNYIPGIQFDGMNVFQARETMKFAKKYALEKGPIMLEANTYRYGGHSMSDSGVSYRTRDEVDQVKATSDPIGKVHRWLVSNELATEEELKAIEKQIKEEVKQAFAQAKEDPVPTPEDMWTNVLAESNFFIRGTELANSYVPK